MKIVLQNVLEASVSVNGSEISKISKGWLLLVGFTLDDNQEIVDKMVNKVSKIRCFLDENGKTNLSIKDVNGEVLSVSQFTLYGDVKKGNRPSYTSSMPGEEAKKLYAYFNEKLRNEGLVVKEGLFGEDMKVYLINDGPFTLTLESKELF